MTPQALFVFAILFSKYPLTFMRFCQLEFSLPFICRRSETPHNFSFRNNRLILKLMLSTIAIVLLAIGVQQALVFLVIFILHTSKPSKMESVRQLAGTCRIAAASDRVLNSECVYTFHTPLRGGIYVSCVDFIGVYRPKIPGLYVKIAQTSKRKDLEQNNNAEATKLAINVEGGFDTERYEIVSQYAVAVVDEACNIAAELPFNDETKEAFPPRVVQSVESILYHTTLTTQQEVTQWELEAEPIPVSKYAADLPFVDNGITISPHPSDWKCQKDGSTANLWLNLSDGYIGGGRKNWDGSGGSNGALDHYEESGCKYPLVVKLGTISQESADCYSYAPDEDGPVKVPNLSELLAKRGIQVGAL
jgi:ubiquitin carboxyl-terminal hydrolase 5/13